MSRTVTLIGPTGNVGGVFASTLIPLAQAGKFKLIIAHRASTDVSKIPDEIEKRVIDVTATPEEIAKVLEGSDVVISGLNHVDETPIIRALAITKPQVWIPSDFGTIWEEADIANTFMPLKLKHESHVEAVKLGVPYIEVRNGLFEHFGFGSPFLEIDVNANAIKLYADAATQPMPFSNINYIIQGVAALIQGDLSSYVNKEVVFVERFATGDELIAALESVNGSKPTVGEITDAEVEAGLQTPLAIKWGLIQKWGKGFHKTAFEPYTTGQVPDWKAKTLTEALASYKQ